MDHLPEYLQDRVRLLSQELGLSIHYSSALPSKYGAFAPLSFSTETRGYLYCLEKHPPEPLERLAKELAPLVGLSPLAAASLDQAVEKLHETEPLFDWTGVYRLVGDVLHLTAFRGKPSPHEIIPRQSGICGAAVTENQTLNIPDVSLDPRYLSCDISAKSELVVPIRNKKGEAIAEIDVDSHAPAAFGAREEALLKSLAEEWAPWVEQL